MTELSARQREAALRRAIIRVQPKYYSWSPEAQERYRVTMPEQDRFRIKQALLQALFGIRVNTEESMEAAIDDFDDARQMRLNETMLLILGVGADSFYLNEYTDDKTILDFPTLYDYDHDDHCFQEQARKEENPEYVVKPYRGRLYYRWARLQIDGAFHYASLCMAAGYSSSLIDELGAARISELIPHGYIAGKNHGRREGTGTVYDQRIDAAGLEGQLEELKGRFYRYVAKRHDHLALEFDQESRKVVYLFDQSRRTIRTWISSSLTRPP